MDEEKTVIGIVIVYVILKIVGVVQLARLAGMKGKLEAALRKIDGLQWMLLQRRDSSNDPETRAARAALLGMDTVPEEQDTPEQVAAPPAVHVAPLASVASAVPVVAPAQMYPPPLIVIEPPAHPAETVPEAVPEAVPETAPRAAEAKVPGFFEKAARRVWDWLAVDGAFRKKGESREFAVATHWLMRAGIMIALTGVVYFLKFSIERGLLGPSGRVALCLLAGAALVAGGARLLHRQYDLLGQGLAGMGLAVLYFAFYSAAGMYRLIPVWAAFALMAGVTAGAGALAVLHASLPIALAGMAGGYVTPVLFDDTVAAGGWFFHAYVLLLGCGVLGVAAVRRWPPLCALGMLASYALAWLFCRHTEAADVLRDFVFLAAVHVLYLLSLVVLHVRRGKATEAFEWFGLAVNAGLFWTWALLLFTPAFGKDATGWVSLAMCAVYAGLLKVCAARAWKDKVAVSLFIALAAVCVAMTPVLMVDARWVTFAWCAQAVAMLWAAERSGQRFLLKVAVALLCAACLRSLALDLPALYGGAGDEGAFWTAALVRWAAFGAVPAALAAAWRRWLGKEPWGDAALAVAIFFGMLFLSFEPYRLSRHFWPVLHAFGGSLTLVWAGCAAGMAGWATRRADKPWLTAVFALLLVMVVAKALTFDAVHLYGRTAPRPGDGAFWLSAGVRFLTFMAVPCAVLASRGLLTRDRRFGAWRGWMLAAALAQFLVYLTLETRLQTRAFLSPRAAGCAVSVAWTLFALGLLFAGIRTSGKQMRWCGLALFALAAGKLLLVDLNGLETVYRVGAALSVGGLLVLGSFLYLRHRSLFLSLTLVLGGAALAARGETVRTVEGAHGDEVVFVWLDDAACGGIAQDWTDLRVRDGRGSEVPFVVMAETGVKTNTTLVSAAMQVKTAAPLPDGGLEVVCEAVAKERVRYTNLIIRTALRDYEQSVTVQAFSTNEGWRVISREQPLYDYSRYADVRKTWIDVSGAGDGAYLFKLTFHQADDETFSPHSTRAEETDGRTNTVRTVKRYQVEKRPFRIDVVTGQGMGWRTTTQHRSHESDVAGMTMTRDAEKRETVLSIPVGRYPVRGVRLFPEQRVFDRAVTVKAVDEEGEERAAGAGRISRLDLPGAAASTNVWIMFNEVRPVSLAVTVHDGDNKPLSFGEGAVSLVRQRYGVAFLAAAGETYRLAYGEPIEKRSPRFEANLISYIEQREPKKELALAALPEGYGDGARAGLVPDVIRWTSRHGIKLACLLVMVVLGAVVFRASGRKEDA
jgi:uncharacterized membrane protein